MTKKISQAKEEGKAEMAITVIRKDGTVEEHGIVPLQVSDSFIEKLKQKIRRE